MKPRLLLLEDEPTSRMFLATALADLAVDTEVAASVAQARSLATGGGHALWLFDVNLPDGTGSGLLADLRQRGLSTPAIAHTASADPGERNRLLAAGFESVVVKPLPAAAWRLAVRRGLERAAPSQPLSEVAARYATGQPPTWDDAAAIAALGGRPDAMATLRKLFLDELPTLRERVIAATRRGDETALRSALHQLRASCGFVGAARLAAAGNALGQAPRCPGRLQDFIEAANATAA